MKIKNTGVPLFIAHFYCVLCKLRVCGTPALRKSFGTIFPTAFPHFIVCGSHFGNSHISDFFIIIFVTVICGQQSEVLPVIL